MKKSLLLFLIFMLVMQFSAFAEDVQYVTVKIDGAEITFDVQPQVINGRTMVPMRKIFEVFGSKVEWIEDSQMIIAAYRESIILMKIDSNTMIIQNVATNENSNIELDVPPQVVDDRTLVPVRAISEALGANVEWDEANSTVLITRN